jgi:hypothetical protein
MHRVRLGVSCVAVAAMLAACTVVTGNGAKDTAAAAPETGCAQSASQTVSLLGTAPDYVVETRSFDGAKPANADAAAVATSNPCANATVVLTVRRVEDGALVHGFVSAMNRMELIEGHAGPAFDGAKLATFLGAWASVATTDAAPAAPSATVKTSLDAAAYSALRARKAPMLCHVTNVHDRACYTVGADDPYTLTPFFTEDQS